ncbi:MAG: hypothetical protein KBC73_20905 [Burkholderiaceae bacterium]|nr:hypothetical protein [Burkholderiaceae bacterium]
MATELSLLQAWSLWLDGPLPADATYLGLKMFVWARAGKVLQFLGGATILAEIIGTQRLRQFGASLHALFSARAALAFLRDVWTFYKSWIGILRHDKNSEAYQQADAQLNATLTGKLWIALLLLLLLGGLALIWSEHDLWGLLVIAVVWFFVLALITPTLVAVLGVAACLALMLVEAGVEATAWLLERPQLDLWIKLFAFLALLVGFHFDFLGS